MFIGGALLLFVAMFAAAFGLTILMYKLKLVPCMYCGNCSDQSVCPECCEKFQKELADHHG